MSKSKRPRKSAETSKKSSARATAFVPKSLFECAFAGVVPAVALAGCGGSSVPDAQLTVAMAAYDAEASVEAAAEASRETGPDVLFGVADVGFQPDAQVIVLAVMGFDAEAGTDATDAAPRDTVFGVADVGFRG